MIDQEVIKKLNESTDRIDGLAKAIHAFVERRESASRSASTVTIHAGGLANAVAVCMSATALALVIVFGILGMVQLSNMQSEQRAWVGVWQQTVAKAAAELHKKDQ